MSYYAWSALLIGLVATFCGIIVIFHDPRSSKNQFFLLYCLTIGIWGYFYGFWVLSSDPNNAVFFLQLALSGSIWIPVMHLHVMILIFNLRSQMNMFVLKLSYVFSLVFFIGNIKGLIVAGTSPKLEFQYWPDPGILYHWRLALFLLLIAYTLHMIWKEGNFPGQPHKKELKIMFWANLVAYGAGVLNEPLWYDIPVPPFLNVTIPVLLIVVTWIMLKTNLVQIKALVVRTSLVFLIYAILLGTTIPVLIFLTTYLTNVILLGTIPSILMVGGLFGVVLSLGPIIYAYFERKSAFLQTQYSTGLTHELKSPLGSIRGAVDLLETASDEQTRDKYVQIIQRNIDRLENFTGDLLNVSKIKTGAFHLNKVWINPHDEIRAIIHDYEPMAHAKNLNINFQSETGSQLFADKEKFDQTLSNVLSNAIKFSKAGTISILCKADRQWLTVSVKDTGKGIASRNLNQIFDRFYQATTNVKGSGIGLTIAKGWVEAHGGKIWAESEGEGKGTTISFSLPGGES